MAWTDVSTGDTVEATHINDIHDALDGTAGKAQPMAFTEVDETAAYALEARNKDATNSLIARFRNAANEVVLSLVKEAVNTAKQIVSTVAVGTAPLVITSTTVVTNLNVDQVDGKDATDLVLRDGTQGLTADWDAGSYEIRAQTFESDVATGTAPMVIASTTKVDNLHVARATLADTVADNSVDDTKVGDRVPQFYRRQGGHATYWDVSGTTGYTPGAVRMQAGVAQVVISDTAQQGYVTITFPVAFSARPFTIWNVDGLMFTLNRTWRSALSAAAMTIYAERSGTSGEVTASVNWLAVGAE